MFMSHQNSVSDPVFICTFFWLILSYHVSNQKYFTIVKHHPQEEAILLF